MANIRNLDTVAYIVRNSQRNADLIRKAERAAKLARLVIVEDDYSTGWLVLEEPETVASHQPDSDEE